MGSGLIAHMEPLLLPQGKAASEIRHREVWAEIKKLESEMAERNSRLTRLRYEARLLAIQMYVSNVDEK